MRQFIRFLLLTLFLGFSAGVIGPTGPVMAQSAIQIPDYENWERTARRADEAIEASRASTSALEALRADLAGWRQEFLDAQSINGNAIVTVNGQLDALGPVPENGQESADIARQREELNTRLSELQAPVKSAELAQSRADGLITGIDGIIRGRQAKELLEFGPSPINPLHWGEGLAALSHTVASVRVEFTNAWHNPVQKAEAKENLPAIVALLVIGFLLVLRGRRWSRKLTNWVLTDQPGAGRWIAGFILSMGSILLPYLGIRALAEAIFATNLVGLRGERIINALMNPLLYFLVSRWVAMRIFPAKEARSLPLNLEAGQRQSGRWYGALMGLVVGGYYFFYNVAISSSWSEAATNVVLFAFYVVAGLILLRLAALLRSHVARSLIEDGDETPLRTQITRFMVLAMAAIAVVSPTLAAVGYVKLAHFLMFPSLVSGLLLAILLVLQRLVLEVYVLVTGNREGASDSLVPVLVGLLLVILSLPTFALIWGARPAQLIELWTSFIQGVDVGGVIISPTIFLTFALVFTIGYLATRLLQGALKNTVLPKTKIDQGGRNAIVSGVGYIGLFLAALIAITSAGLDLSSIAIVAGALSVGIGFGLRTIVENFVSGIILLIERPISEGDWIEVGGVHGTVRDISVRSTRIETFDRSDVILPNADLVAGRVTNYTRGNTVGRVIVPVGVAYGSDTRRIEGILQEIAEAHPMVLANPAPSVVFKGFGADALDFEIRAILRDVNYVLSVRSDLNHEIARRFVEEGIEIPFSQRDIWIRNPETLVPGAKPPAPEPEAVKSASGSNHLSESDMDDGTGHGEADAAGDGGDR